MRITGRARTPGLRPGSEKRVVRVVMCLGAFGLAIFIAVAGWVAGFGVLAQPDKSDCIIVLGCRLYGTEPSPFLTARLEEGFRLVNEGYASRIIVSGGQGPDEDIPEAEDMKRYLVGKGCDPSDIICEDKSTSTAENLRFSQAKMEEHNLNTAIVVSNRYHLLRASLVARRLGIDATYSGIFVSRHKGPELTGYLREIPALVYTLLTGS